MELLVCVAQIFNYSLQLTCKQLEPSSFYNARRMSHRSVIGHSNSRQSITYSKVYRLLHVRKTRIFVVRAYDVIYTS